MNKINYDKVRKSTDRELRFLSSLFEDRLEQIRKRVIAIRNLKTYKERIVSKFQLSDIWDYLVELNLLNVEYNRILNFYDDGFNLLTSYEKEAIRGGF